MTIECIADTNIYIGNSNDSRDINNLKRLGISNVVNVAKDLEGPWFHGEFRNYKIPLLDGPGNKVYQYVIALQILQTLLARDKKVLLHCHAGQSRSPAVASAMLVLLGKSTSLQEAFNIVKASRSVANVQQAHWPMLEQALQRMK
jgi:rhodanese-related sulfurtransferase